MTADLVSATGPTADDIAAHLLALPDVHLVVADEASGAPPISWGHRFFFAGPDRRRPFATLGEHDMPGFDDQSHLDRPGVWRLNLDLGRAEFHRRFGYPPAQFTDHRAGLDFTALDEILPHPVYATAAWACVLNPGTRSLPEAQRMIAYAHQRARRRRQPRD